MHTRSSLLLLLKSLLLTVVAICGLSVQSWSKCWIGETVIQLMEAGEVVWVINSGHDPCLVQYNFQYGAINLRPGQYVRVTILAPGDYDCTVTRGIFRDGATLVYEPHQGTYVIDLYDEGEYHVFNVPGYAIPGEDHEDHRFRIMHVDGPMEWISLRLYADLDGPSRNTLHPALLGTQLTANGLLPDTCPYGGPGYPFGSSTFMLNEQASGLPEYHSLVDWIVVELRDPEDPSIVLTAQGALLTKCLTVVSPDLKHIPMFEILPGYYHIAIRHRNHLSMCTANQVYLGGGAQGNVNFTSQSTALWGTDTRNCHTPNNCRMRAGNSSSDAMIKYVGVDNDRDAILQRIGGISPTATLSGYHPEDVNLDGVVKYVGANNDRDIILQALGGSIPTMVIHEQLP